MPVFHIRRGFDARQWFIAAVEAKDEASALAMARGDTPTSPDTEWARDTLEDFDTLEAVELLYPTEGDPGIIEFMPGSFFLPSE